MNLKPRLYLNYHLNQLYLRHLIVRLDLNYLLNLLNQMNLKNLKNLRNHLNQKLLRYLSYLSYLK